MNRIKKAEFARRYGITRQRVGQLAQEGRLGTVGKGRKQEIDLDDPLTIETAREIQQNKADREASIPAIHLYAGNTRVQSLTYPDSHTVIEMIYPLSEIVMVVEGKGGRVAIMESGQRSDIRQGTTTWKRLTGRFPGAFPPLPDPTAPLDTDDMPGNFLFIQRAGQFLPIRCYKFTDKFIRHLFYPLPEMIRLTSRDDQAPYAETANGKRYEVWWG